MVVNCVEKTISDHDLVNKDMHIVLGLSGGPDSVCLFHVLYCLKEKLGFSLHVVHVNHQFRPGEAEADQEYTENLCKSFGVPCYTFTFDCNSIAGEEGITSEEAGRKVRYQAFVETARHIRAKGVDPERIKIAVAQNADDQAETILFRILRGTGTDGLSGISYKRREAEFQVIRPLLDVSRDQITAYCREQNLEPCIDKTNLEPIYTRNKIRLNLLPYLEEEFNENIKQTLNRLSKIAGEDKDYLWQQAEQAYAQAKVSDTQLSTEALNNFHPAIRHRVIMKALNEVGMKQNISAVHLSAVDSILQNSNGSKTLDLPDGYKITVAYGRMCSYREGGTSDAKKWRLKMSLVQRVENLPGKGAVFDWDKITEEYGEPEIRIRYREPGDYIRTKVGRKKIQDFFIDEKIPREIRGKIPMVAIGNEILWIVGTDQAPLGKHKYNAKYALNNETKKILSLETICEI